MTLLLSLVVGLWKKSICNQTNIYQGYLDSCRFCSIPMVIYMLCYIFHLSIKPKPIRFNIFFSNSQKNLN